MTTVHKQWSYFGQLKLVHNLASTERISKFQYFILFPSVDELLQARNDPEELLRNLGFCGVVETDSPSRIPDRFLKAPSSARGINVQEFLDYEHQKEENRAAAVGGYLGIEGDYRPWHFRKIMSVGSACLEYCL